MQRLSFILIALLAAGAGFFARAWVAPHLDDHAEEEHHDEHDDHEEEPHVPLTKEAFDTLRLVLEPAAVADFVKTSNLPAEVVEYPGVSAYKLAAPVTGVVTAIATQPGATVNPGDALFELQITDERVLDAQLQLLEALTRIEIVDDELRRLEPLAASGAVRGKQRLDYEYERRELQTTIALRRSELEARGLTGDQVDQLIRTKELLRTVVVRTPLRRNRLSGPQAAWNPEQVQAVAWEEDASGVDFSSENLLVQPGQTVQRGEALCDLASHGRLYLRGLAYEGDLASIVGLAKSGETISAEFGHSMTSHHGTSRLVQGLRVRYVANHVDPETQSYEFYLPLTNEVLSETTDGAGFQYRTWRFSVGQRAHVLLPTERIDGQIPLPIDAVAIDGPNAIVFRKMAPHEHAKPSTAEEIEVFFEREEPYVELEPVPVTLLYRDNRNAVVAAGGALQQGDPIAKNAAYQLFLAMQATTEGGGHHHDHDH